MVLKTRVLYMVIIIAAVIGCIVFLGKLPSLRQGSSRTMTEQRSNVALFACTLWLSTDRLQIKKVFGEPTKEEAVAETIIWSYDCGNGEKIMFFFDTEGKTIMVQSSRDEKAGAEYSMLIPGIPVYALRRLEFEETLGLTSGVMYEYPGFSRAGKRTDEIWIYSLMPKGATLYVRFDAETGDVGTVQFALRDFRDRAWGICGKIGE